MTQAILIVGNWASGKTELLNFYEEQFALQGIPTVIDSDRLRFEEQVLRDAVTHGQHDASRDIYVGNHSYLTKDGPPGYRHFRVRDGVLPNIAHELMMMDIVRDTGGPLRLIEFAMAPDIHEFEGESRTTFYQDGRYVLELLEKYGLLDRVVVIELVAPLEVRLKRQIRRDDNVDMEAFHAFAPDGGELFPHAMKLQDRYIRFNNVYDDHDTFIEHASAILREHILPRLSEEGRQATVEGATQKEFG